MTLSVALTPHTHQSNPSHSATHNTLAGIYNAYFDTGIVGKTTPWRVTTRGRLFDVVDGETATPVTTARPSWKLSRYERIAAADIPNVNDGQYASSLHIDLGSAVGNDSQPMGLAVDVLGYVTGANYLLGANLTALHSGHAAVGGAMGAFLAVDSVVNANDVSIDAIGLAVGNSTGFDMTADSMRSALIDGAIGSLTKISGNGYQVRASGLGGCAALYVNGPMKSGIDLSTATISSEYAKWETHFRVRSDGTNPIHEFDTNDYMAFVRASNSYGFFVGAVATLSFSPGLLAFAGLPNADPGLATTFWYDPADGNRVKYHP